MLKTQAEISKLLGTNHMEVSRFIAKNGVQPAGAKGKLKTHNCGVEPLKSWIAEKKPDISEADEKWQRKNLTWRNTAYCAKKRN